MNIIKNCLINVFQEIEKITFFMLSMIVLKCFILQFKNVPFN